MSNPFPFKLNLGEKAVITASGETGDVIGRAEYSNSASAYLIRYKAADGRAVESWWPEDAISGAFSENKSPDFLSQVLNEGDAVYRP